MQKEFYKVIQLSMARLTKNKYLTFIIIIILNILYEIICN